MRHSRLPRDQRGDRAPLSRLAKRPLRRWREGRWTRGTDRLAGEEPLEVRVDGRSLAVTMRTPGEDFELVAGFLHSEGLLTDPAQVDRMVASENAVDVRLRVPADLSRFERRVYTSSSCGMCGKASLDRVEVACSRRPVGAFRLAPDDLAVLPDRLREVQKLFEATGGLHGCGLFTPAGELLAAREDVGRHNALDKLVGSLFLAGKLPLDDTVLVLSGRASFELVQKAVLAGIPVVLAVGAPSSLAVSLAEQHGVTLCGFVRAGRMNVYSGWDRLA